MKGKLLFEQKDLKYFLTYCRFLFNLRCVLISCFRLKLHLYLILNHPYNGTFHTVFSAEVLEGIWSARKVRKTRSLIIGLVDQWSTLDLCNEPDWLDTSPPFYLSTDTDCASEPYSVPNMADGRRWKCIKTITGNVACRRSDSLELCLTQKTWGYKSCSMKISLLLGVISKLPGTTLKKQAAISYERYVRTDMYGVKRLKSRLDFKCYINSYLIFGGFGLHEVSFRLIRGTNLL